MVVIQIVSMNICNKLIKIFEIYYHNIFTAFTKFHNLSVTIRFEITVCVTLFARTLDCVLFIDTRIEALMLYGSLILIRGWCRNTVAWYSNCVTRD